MEENYQFYGCKPNSLDISKYIYKKILLFYERDGKARIYRIWQKILWTVGRRIIQMTSSTHYFQNSLFTFILSLIRTIEIFRNLNLFVIVICDWYRIQFGRYYIYLTKLGCFLIFFLMWSKSVYVLCYLYPIA